MLLFAAQTAATMAFGGAAPQGILVGILHLLGGLALFGHSHLHVRAALAFVWMGMSLDLLTFAGAPDVVTLLPLIRSGVLLLLLRSEARRWQTLLAGVTSLLGALLGALIALCMILPFFRLVPADLKGKVETLDVGHSLKTRDGSLEIVLPRGRWVRLKPAEEVMQFQALELITQSWVCVDRLSGDWRQLADGFAEQTPGLTIGQPLSPEGRFTMQRPGDDEGPAETWYFKVSPGYFMVMSNPEPFDKSWAKPRESLLTVFPEPLELDRSRMR